ncbi:GntR family transcriptional regulator [Acetobacter pasteurianus]|uniref:Putative HTH-type transcriptional regulator YhdI n=1 Tax=Acetobacter pasteurianus TaxID=438 RepID=A0A1A0DE76_ACEPA|nr:PLP-dependent aminotransferase family protein [Acetobacter pasteurianus]OAZ73578.1 putative HTH-type transcriptional regulator YhdI [Acetobacter pasteurianus]RCL08083.1 GntR family transcriptional regulator [Acetobacter pasteurianus]GAB30522.1 transcriptional regulator GntR [Acetobacter pasteurianus subsp. pasteurianus LMG 1262 = NBRC 106471]GCD50467.1 GntR family transcriptional regulator [Acetobacter pasteurianus subsp. pasteurianus LMG 1262 = NBRC 106471]
MSIFHSAFLQSKSSAKEPVTNQIVHFIQGEIEKGHIALDDRLPSIRMLADLYSVSHVTAASVYNKLSENGYIKSKNRSGYYVIKNPVLPSCTQSSFNPDWLLQHAYEDTSPHIKAGGGWLSEQQIFTSSIQKSLKNIAQSNLIPSLMEYGDPAGLRPLRTAIRNLLERRNIHTIENSITLTHGASQALELSLRACTQPGDIVLVDDPGYCNLYLLLQNLNLRAVGIPYTKEGPDTDALLEIQHQTKAQVMVTTSVLHNPTGICTSLDNIYKINEISKKIGLILIEDNIFLDLAPIRQPCLSQGNNNNVIHIGSFSKTIGPGLRVGYVIAPTAITQKILSYKMSISLTTPQINEMIVHNILKSGLYISHLSDLREQLFQNQKKVSNALKSSGLEVYNRPMGGLFIWARFAFDISPLKITQIAAENNILLAPGYLFRPNQAPSQWFRFNVTLSDKAELYTFLKNTTRIYSHT